MPPVTTRRTSTRAHTHASVPFRKNPQGTTPMLRRLYRVAIHQRRGSMLVAGSQRSQAQLLNRLVRAGVAIPTDPAGEAEVAHFR